MKGMTDVNLTRGGFHASKRCSNKFTECQVDTALRACSQKLIQTRQRPGRSRLVEGPFLQDIPNRHHIRVVGPELGLLDVQCPRQKRTPNGILSLLGGGVRVPVDTLLKILEQNISHLPLSLSNSQQLLNQPHSTNLPFRGG